MAIGEVFLVEGLGQVVAQRGFVHLALENLVQAVVVGELQDRARTHQDLVPILQHVPVHTQAAAESSVGRTQVVQDHAVAFDLDLAMLAGNAVVHHTDVRGLAAADDGLGPGNLEHLAHGAAGENDEVGLVAARQRLGGSGRVFLNPRDVVPADGHGSPDRITRQPRR